MHVSPQRLQAPKRVLNKYKASVVTYKVTWGEAAWQATKGCLYFMAEIHCWSAQEGTVQSFKVSSPNPAISNNAHFEGSFPPIAWVPQLPCLPSCGEGRHGDLLQLQVFWDGKMGVRAHVGQFQCAFKVASELQFLRIFPRYSDVEVYKTNVKLLAETRHLACVKPWAPEKCLQRQDTVHPISSFNHLHSEVPSCRRVLSPPQPWAQSRSSPDLAGPPLLLGWECWAVPATVLWVCF